MVKIIEYGPKEFFGKCRFCGCEFTYELKDLDMNGYVKCPECEDCRSWQHPDQSRQTKVNWGTVSPCIVEDQDTFFIPVDNNDVMPV